MDQSGARGCQDSGTGISKMLPRTDGHHTYRTTIRMGYTKLSLVQVEKLLEMLKDKWPGNTYNMIYRNCNHFSDAFCGLLGCNPLPAWIFGVLQHTQEAQELEVLGERSPLLCQDAVRVDALQQRLPDDSCSCSCPLRSPRRNCTGKENHKITPLANISASIPPSPETQSEALIMGNKAVMSPLSVTKQGGDRDRSARKLNFLDAADVESPVRASSTIFKMRSEGWQWNTIASQNEPSAEIDLEAVDQQASQTDEGSLWKELTHNEHDVADAEHDHISATFPEKMASSASAR